MAHRTQSTLLKRTPHTAHKAHSARSAQKHNTHTLCVPHAALTFTSGSKAVSATPRALWALMRIASEKTVLRFCPLTMSSSAPWVRRMRETFTPPRLIRKLITW